MTALTFSQSQDEVARLVKHFHNNRAIYLASTYSEHAARNDFIDPLFIALGWDVRNEQRAATSTSDHELLQRQIDAMDQQIDALVYELYGLTGEEIKLVEGTD